MWAKRLLAHSEPQLQSHKVLTRALIEGCHLGMPTGQATSDRALATLNKFCRQGAIGRGGSGLWPSFQTWYAGARALGGYAQAGATHDAARDRTEHRSMQLPKLILESCHS